MFYIIGIVSANKISTEYIQQEMKSTSLQKKSSKQQKKTVRERGTK